MELGLILFALCIVLLLVPSFSAGSNMFKKEESSFKSFSDFSPKKNCRRRRKH